MALVRIASRKSALARIQSYLVAQRLQAAVPGLEVSFHFSESMGDKNLEDPLWKLPEKGVFTQDLQNDLLAGRCDVVVHSWKDLPIEGHTETEVTAALPRADVRDLLVLKRRSIKPEAMGRALRVLSSSPRRAHNLVELIPELLPFAVEGVDFVDVRGNVPTRFEKLFSGDADALVVAKAGLDRLLMPPKSPDADLEVTALRLKGLLEACVTVVLPSMANPAAPAQGALAIEIRKDRDDLRQLFAQIHAPETAEDARDERAILEAHGGGCHQKIGASVLRHPLGRVLSVRGLTEKGTELREWRWIGREMQRVGVARADAWPLDPREARFFERVPLQTKKPSGSNAFFVSRADAWPSDWELGPREIVWASGLETWKKLARRGCWVHGCAESLGETVDESLEPLWGERSWVKLSHDRAPSSGFPLLSTYRLKALPEMPALAGKKAFYWMSASAFEVAVARWPEIRGARHACGPGNTYERLELLLGDGAAPQVFLDHASWLAALD